MTGLTDQMRADRNAMQEMASYQRLAPQKRVDGAIAHLTSLNQ
jgi:hypothetical protein